MALGKQVLPADSTAFQVAMLEFTALHFGWEAEARLAEMLGDRKGWRRRRNGLIRELDQEICGAAGQIRPRAAAVLRALDIAFVPAVADKPNDRRRALAREILALTGGKAPKEDALRLILAGSDAEVGSP